MPRNLRRWNLHILSPISHQGTTGISSLREKEKYVTFVSRKSNFLILLEIRNRPFATRILSLPPWPAPTLVAAILFLPDSVEFFKRCASAQTCAIHEIYPLTDDFNVSDATCAYSASCIKKGRHKLGTFWCPTRAREDFEGSVFYIFSRELCFFFSSVIVYFYPSRFYTDRL